VVPPPAVSRSTAASAPPFRASLPLHRHRSVRAEARAVRFRLPSSTTCSSRPPGRLRSLSSGVRPSRASRGKVRADSWCGEPLQVGDQVSCRGCSRWCVPPLLDVLPPNRTGPPGTGPCGPACAHDQAYSRLPGRSRPPAFHPTFSLRPSENVRVDPIGRCRPRGLVSNCERASTFERQCRIPVGVGQRRIA
jgi:hypothetical protein